MIKGFAFVFITSAMMPQLAVVDVGHSNGSMLSFGQLVFQTLQTPASSAARASNGR